MEYGAPPEETAAELTALQHAAKNGQADIVAMLVYCGAQPERLDPDSGWTPLQSAVEEGHTTTVQALLEAGADPDASASSMSPPLARAAREGRADILRLLVEFGADLNREEDGWTPLRLAEFGKHEEIVAYLQSKGAESP